MYRKKMGYLLANALKGIIIAAAASLVAAILFAYVFRVPIPFVGYVGPFGEISSYGTGFAQTVRTVFSAWVFYGRFGGLIVLPIFGAIAGILAGRPRAPAGKNRKLLVWSAVAGVIPVFVLSVLDYIIGPW